MQTPTKNFRMNPKLIIIVLIHILARDENAGAKVCGELSKELNVTNIKYHQLDITSQESINKLRDHVVEKFGGLDVLINNSGVLLKVIQNLTSFICKLDSRGLPVKQNQNWGDYLFESLNPKKFILKVKLCRFNHKKMYQVFLNLPLKMPKLSQNIYVNNILYALSFVSKRFGDL